MNIDIIDKNQQVQSKYQTEGDDPPQSALGAQVVADLAAFERYVVEVPPGGEDALGYPNSPGARSYLSSLLGPMSNGGLSPSPKNRHMPQPHRFSIDKFQMNAIRQRPSRGNSKNQILSLS